MGLCGMRPIFPVRHIVIQAFMKHLQNGFDQIQTIQVYESIVLVNQIEISCGVAQLSHIQPICSRRLWTYLGKKIKIKIYVYDSMIIDQRWKHCDKRSNCSQWAISHYASMFSNAVCCSCTSKRVHLGEGVIKRAVFQGKLPWLRSGLYSYW